MCPVGALTSKIYAFKTRPWELKVCESFDVLDGLGTSLYINFKDNEIEILKLTLNEKENLKLTLKEIENLKLKLNEIFFTQYARHNKNVSKLIKISINTQMTFFV